MASGGAAVDTRHTDMIHDAQFDYYGKRVATCSSDKTIKIHSVSEGNTSTQLAELRGHEGPVWQVAWAHPRFGSVIASCSYDRRVLVWKEKEVQSSSAQAAQSTWEIIYQYAGHELSVNSIAWAPHDQLVLACASSDGYISILTYKEGDNKWETSRFLGHNVGANSVSWAPAVSPSSLLSSTSPSSPNASSSSSSVGGPAPRRLVSGGSDRLVKLWSEIGGKWVEDENSKLTGHNDWVRDVAWAPSIGLPGQTIASCSQDCTVIIWSQADPTSVWTSKTLTFKDVVWRASWSVTGNILAVASGDNLVSLWKEQVDGEWKQIQSVDEPLDS